MTDPGVLQVAWADGTQVELVENGELSQLSLVNVGGAAGIVAAPLAELVSVLRMIATTGAGDYSHGNDLMGWTVGWEATDDGSVGVAVAITAGGGNLLVDGMTATYDETVDLVAKLDAYVADQAGRWRPWRW